MSLKILSVSQPLTIVNTFCFCNDVFLAGAWLILDIFLTIIIFYIPQQRQNHERR